MKSPMNAQPQDKTTDAGADLLRPFLLPEVLDDDQVDYSALAEFGSCYESTMQEINRASKQAQVQRALTFERRRARAELCNAEKRLLLDLWHVQPDPRVFGIDADDEAVDWPRPQPPEIRWPAIAPPSREAWLAAIAELPVPAAPPPLDVGPPPAIAPDIWKLLMEIWPVEQPPLAPVSPPDSFLENLA